MLWVFNFSFQKFMFLFFYDFQLIKYVWFNKKAFEQNNDHSFQAEKLLQVKIEMKNKSLNIE